MSVIIVIFVINDTKLSSYIADISEHITSSNHKIYSYDQIGKMIVNLSNKKCRNSNNATGHINHIHKLLLKSIVNTPEKDVSNVDRKVDKRKIHTSLIKSSSTLFSCSIRTMYNRVHRVPNKCLMLKSFIPSINTSFFPKKYYEISFLKTYQ